MFPGSPPSARPVTLHDRAAILALLRGERTVHQHLDWRSPESWIGETPFLLAESGGRLVGCLACPPDPPSTAWIRLFAAAGGQSPEGVWEALWPKALAELLARRVEVIAALNLEAWLGALVSASGFSPEHSVVILSRRRSPLPAAPSIDAEIRPMQSRDLPAVAQLDLSAFRPPWQQSHDSLLPAFAQAEVASVAELGGRIVGYQISTPTHVGGHLARLAVEPGLQGNGIGRALTLAALAHFERHRTRVVTVNTQNDNSASLALYRSLGFELTGEEYEVHVWQRQGEG